MQSRTWVSLRVWHGPCTADFGRPRGVSGGRSRTIQLSPMQVRTSSRVRPLLRDLEKKWLGRQLHLYGSRLGRHHHQGGGVCHYRRSNKPTSASADLQAPKPVISFVGRLSLSEPHGDPGVDVRIPLEGTVTRDAVQSAVNDVVAARPRSPWEKARMGGVPAMGASQIRRQTQVPRTPRAWNKVVASRMPLLAWRRWICVEPVKTGGDENGRTKAYVSAAILCDICYFGIERSFDDRPFPCSFRSNLMYVCGVLGQLHGRMGGHLDWSFSCRVSCHCCSRGGAMSARSRYASDWISSDRFAVDLGIAPPCTGRSST